MSLINMLIKRFYKALAIRLLPYFYEVEREQTDRQISMFSNRGAGVSAESFVELRGEQYIRLGDNVSFGHSSFITAWDSYNEQSFTPSIVIGNDCLFGAYNHITAINQIIIGDGCMTGKWVTITDNSHGGTDFCSLQEKPIDRLLCSKGPVTIGKNVWIGDKATILPGVKIGDGVVIGANTVVTKDIPSFHIAVGNPCRIIKSKDYKDYE